MVVYDEYLVYLLLLQIGVIFLHSHVLALRLLGFLLACQFELQPAAMVDIASWAVYKTAWDVSSQVLLIESLHYFAACEFSEPHLVHFSTAYNHLFSNNSLLNFRSLK